MNSSRRFLDPRREEEDNGRFVGFDRRIFLARNDHRPEEESGGSLRSVIPDRLSDYNG
jgi:hypothetical protein